MSMYLSHPSRVMWCAPTPAYREGKLDVKAIKVRSSIGMRVALGATALAIVGSGLVASPAQAAPAVADDLAHCVVVLPYTGIAKCFATFEEAQQFGDGGDVGPKNPQAGASDTGSAARFSSGAALVVLTRLSVEYDLPLFLGRTLTLYGTNGPCTTTTADTDYQMSSMPLPPATSVNWNQRVSSFITYNNCWMRHYDLVSWGLPFVGYSGTQASIGGGLDNDTSSMRVS
jgi:hypothetical protein